MARKTLITNWVHDTVIDFLKTRGDVVANPNRIPWRRIDLLARMQGVDSMIAFMPDHIDEDFLAQSPDLRVIACALKGADNFDLVACQKRGVAVSIVPDLLTAPTAELTIGLMITLGRNILNGHCAIRESGFSGWRPEFYGTGLDGATVGVVGMGAIGQAIVHRLRAFRCRITYCEANPLSPAKEDALGLIRSELNSLLETSDYLVLALPLTPATHHIVNAATLSKMKRGALLINPARGSLVDESSVADALESGALGGYAADVFELEDWALADRPTSIEQRLLAHANTVFTPHLGSAVRSVRRDIEMAAARDIIRYLDGEPMSGRVV